MMLLLGLDPGLRRTGWGVIKVAGNRLTHIANGTICSTQDKDMAQRLMEIHTGLRCVLEQYQPDEAAVEETFANTNPTSTLALGMARAIALLAPAQSHIKVVQYLPNTVKKSVVGAGHADKAQVQLMVERLLSYGDFSSADAADALAVAICHAHQRTTHTSWGQALVQQHKKTIKTQKSHAALSVGGYPVYQRAQKLNG